MLEFILWAILCAFILWLTFPLMLAVALLIKIWAHVDQEVKAEYNRLELLVRQANKGDADAIKTCEIDSYNIKSCWWRKNRFSVRRKVLYACYGHY